MKTMNTIVFISLVLLGLVATDVFAAKDQDPRYLDGIYYSDLDYPGSFEGNNIYKQLEEGRDLEASRVPANLSQVRCGEAENALRRMGRWHGRLDSRGKCLTGDPIEWLMGNYLNFVEYRNLAE